LGVYTCGGKQNRQYDNSFFHLSGLKYGSRFKTAYFDNREK
jgi:hypothetical protein